MERKLFTHIRPRRETLLVLGMVFAAILVLDLLASLAGLLG